MQPEAMERGAEKRIWKRKRKEMRRPHFPYASRRKT
jgi:hypothetical protein